MNLAFYFNVLVSLRRRPRRAGLLHAYRKVGGQLAGLGFVNFLAEQALHLRIYKNFNDNLQAGGAGHLHLAKPSRRAK